MTLLTFSGIAANNYFAMGQTNATTEGSGGNTAKMHVDEALKALQSNDNNGATMHLQELKIFRARVINGPKGFRNRYITSP